MSNEDLSKGVSMNLQMRLFDVPPFIYSSAERGPRVGVPLGEFEDAVLEDLCKRFRDAVFELAAQQRETAKGVKR